MTLLCTACLEPATEKREEAKTDSSFGIDYQERLDRLFYLPLEKYQEQLPASYLDTYIYLEKAAEKMDDIFWEQSYGDKDSLLKLLQDSSLRKLVELNYGPYDRMESNKALIAGLEEKSREPISTL
ncbi:MAG: hypothetical protein AAF696_24840 [Bacteroidota bacterium]